MSLGEVIYSVIYGIFINPIARVRMGSLVAGDPSCLFNFLEGVCLATTTQEVVSLYLAFTQKLFYITINLQSL